MIFNMKTVVEPEVEDYTIPLNPMQAIIERPSIGWNIGFTLLDSDTSAQMSYKFAGTRLRAPASWELLTPDDLGYLREMRDELNRALGDD